MNLHRRNDDVSSTLQHNHTEAEYVGLSTVLPAEDLWRHVLSVALTIQALGAVNTEGSWPRPSGCHAIIADTKAPFDGDEDIGGFQVEVDHILVVNMEDTLENTNRLA